jgi:hypothetical protein
VRKNRDPRSRVRTDAVHLPVRPMPHPTGFTHPTPFAVLPDPTVYGRHEPAGYGYPDPMLYPPYVEAEPDPPPRRWPWIVLGLAAVVVVGLLCWLIAQNAALFAVVTAITIIIVCGGGQEVARRRRDDW